MPRARFQNQDDWQTAAAYETGSGCLSFYMLPVLAVFVIAGFLTVLALNSPISVAAPIYNSALQTPVAQVNNTDPAAQVLAPAVDNPIVPSPDSALSITQPEVTNPLWNFSVDNSTSSSGLSPIFTPEIQHWGDDIIRWANAASVDPNLAAVVMQIESCGDPQALSRSGAMGLFQVMPFHFHRGENGFNPETNALRGMNYLSRSLSTGGGNARLALAGYNGGIGVISRSEWSWPAETKRYVLYGAPIYEDARGGATSSPMLAEWYRKYGAGLCRQANERLNLAD
ncbi:MAG TPA: lytic transglycosylase domain-containing protein [Anaerolineales bacterium]|nr:lytic transglycosylase domain-containing protein [Anaerolineales bacterium]